MKPLQESVITLDFGFGGLDQKTDPKRVVATRFSELENVRFNKTGRVDRRYGMQGGFAGSDLVQTPGLPTCFTVNKLLANDDQLYAINTSLTELPAMYRVMSTGAANAKIGGRVDVPPVPEIITNPIGPTSPASSSTYRGFNRADSLNYFCLAVARNAAQMSIEVYDRFTGALIKSESVTGQAPVVLANPDGRDEFLIGYVTPGASNTVSWRLAVPNANTALTTCAGLPDESITTVSTIGSSFDAVVIADVIGSNSAKVFVAHAKGATGFLLRQAAWPNTSGSAPVASSTTTIAPSAGVTNAVWLASMHNPSLTTQDVRPVWTETTGALVRTATYNHALTQVLAPASVTTGITPERVVAVQLGNGTTQVLVQANNSTTAHNRIEAFSVNASNVASAFWTQLGLSLQSRGAAESGGSAVYVWCNYTGTQQNTMYLLGSYSDATWSTTAQVRLLGRAYHCTALEAATAILSGRAVNLQRTATGYVSIGAYQARFITPGAGSGGSGGAVDTYALAELNFQPLSSTSAGWLGSQNRNELLFTGGYLGRQNGIDALMPNGPQMFPTLVAGISATTGGSLSVGSMAVSGFWEYIDTSGRIMRSAPALPQTVTLSGTQNAIAGQVEQYRLPDGLSGKLSFVPFVTLANETIYYRTLGTVSSTNTSNTVAFSITAVTAASEPLYTTGGVFENWQPSAPIAIATNGRRYLVVQGDRPNFVMEGKPVVDGQTVAFMDDVGRTIAPNGPRIYALASYLDKWFAFKEDAIFVAQGDGADVTGQNDTLSEFQPLTNGLGTTTPRSVVTTSIGVAFQSQKGFYLIGGDLSPVYIGAAVEDYTSPVVDAGYDEVSDTVHFVLADGTILVLTIYVTESSTEVRWSADTGLTGARTLTFLGGLRYIGCPTAMAESGIAQEATDSFYDFNTTQALTPGGFFASAYPAMNIETAWIPAVNLQGFGRLWKILVIGNYPNETTPELVTISVQIAYDYSDTYAETKTFQVVYDAFDPANPTVQFEIRPNTQRFEAVRFRITQTATDGFNAGTGLQLTQMSLKIGAKALDNKLPAAKRATDV